MSYDPNVPPAEYQNAPAYVVNGAGDAMKVFPFKYASKVFPTTEYGVLDFLTGHINVVVHTTADAATLDRNIRSGAVQLNVPQDLPTDLVSRIRDTPINMIVAIRHQAK